MSETDLWYGTLAATVRVDDLPASRRVVAIELPDDGQWRVCGYGVSDGSGIAQLGITGLPTSRIYAVAIDDWGRPFVPGMTVAFGDVIRPTQFLGWMYQVTAPGEMPSTEPDWWNSMAGVPQPVGTAMMQAVRHYQPIAHGPVSDIEWVEQEFDPHWDKVVSLLRFDSDFSDEISSNNWAVTGTGVSISQEQSRFGGALRSDGVAGGRLGIDSAVPLRIQAHEDFTIEMFAYLDSDNTEFHIFNTYTGTAGRNLIMQRISATGVLGIYTETQTTVSSGLLISPEVWHHIALVRRAGEITPFVDGVAGAGWAYSGAYDFDTFRFLVWTYRNQAIKGGIDEFRITKGVARYTENFDPPTAPFPNVGPPL